MKKWILVVSCLMILLLIGCEDIQRLFGLLPPGKITLSTGNSTGEGGISSASMGTMASSSEHPDFVLTFTIEKVEISKDGSSWITILGNSVEINTEDFYEYHSETDSWGTGLNVTLNAGMEIGEGGYYAIRVYFGPNITAKDYDLIFSTITTEKTRTDFNENLYPVYICQRDGPWTPSGSYRYLVNSPIKIEKGKKTKILLWVQDTKVIGAAVDTDIEWATFRDNINDDPFVIGGMVSYETIN